jgi:hypothetical protein
MPPEISGGISIYPGHAYIGHAPPFLCFDVVGYHKGKQGKTYGETDQGIQGNNIWPWGYDSKRCNNQPGH